MICDDDFYAGKCPARKEDGRCVSKFPCSHKVEPPKPPTNADRIRAMSDEQLALWICGVYDIEEENGKFINGIIIPGYAPHDIEEWLQQPAGEEDKHENYT